MIYSRQLARNKLAAQSFEVRVEKYSVLHIADCCRRFGERSCATRPHVVCPIPAVEVDISDTDLYLPARPRSGENGEMSVDEEMNGSSRCLLIAEIAVSNAEEGDFS